MSDKNHTKDIQYTTGGIGHTKESFTALVDRSYGLLSKLVNVEDRVKAVRKEKQQQADDHSRSSGRNG